MEFIPSLAVLSAFTLAGLVLAITPGPDMTLYLSRALTQGRAAGMAAMLGASAGIIIHTLLAAFGISALIQASPTGFLVLKIVGAVYLLWLAIQAIREGSSLALEGSERKATNLFSTWATGIGINLLNPKIVIFFITFLPQFVSSTDPAAAGKMIFLGFYFIAMSIILCTAMIYAADTFSSALRRNPKVTRAIDWLFAGVFSAFAVKILFTERG